MASTPIGPEPVTSTFLPSSGPARLAAWRQTASGSAKAALEALTPSATFTAWRSSITSASRKPPWTWGKRIALP